MALAISMSLDLATKMCVQVVCVTFRPKHVNVGAQFSSLLFYFIRCCLLVTWVRCLWSSESSCWLAWDEGHRKERNPHCYQSQRLLEFFVITAQPGLSWLTLSNEQPCVCFFLHRWQHFCRNKCLLQSQSIQLPLKHLFIHPASTFCPLAPLHLLILDSFLLFIHDLLDKCLPQTNQELPGVCWFFCLNLQC